ncbi:ParA family protein [Pseudomonas aeruginosa]|uniref:ParA family protein n=1 Tax=Pseudomonas aeruginosa TaxID=287 RepID=UPI003D065C9F
MPDGIKTILENHSKVVEEGFVREGSLRYNSYAVTTLRGGVGKSTLTFNLAYEISRKHPLLISDLCAQRNLTENLMRGVDADVTILDALQPALLGAAFGDTPEDISYRASAYCDSFKGGKNSYFIPGNAELFAFPSTLYQQLQIANAQSNKLAIRNLLEILKKLLANEAKDKKATKIIMDTSPFYAGGTHLAWCAADAVIIPVRVDEHSIDSLNLTLDMLSNPNKDFVIWNQRAGGLASPKVAAIVITMAGAKSQKRNTPDSASRMYIERALSIAEKYPKLFDHQDLGDAIVITDDFMSTGRISGAKSIPIDRLKVGSFHNVEGKRLQVNASAERYKKELKYLVSVI